MNTIDKINTVAGLRDPIPSGFGPRGSNDVGNAQLCTGEGTEGERGVSINSCRGSLRKWDRPARLLFAFSAQVR